MRRLSLLLVGLLLLSLPLSAQIAFGVKGGMNLSDVSISSPGNLVKASNRTGFYVGPSIEAMIPFLGVGLDASIVYARKGVDITVVDKTFQGDVSYIDVPINLKWKIGIPNVVGVFLAAGPYLSYSVGDSFRDFRDNFEIDEFDWGLNAGGGIELLGKLQIGASYSWGITKSQFIFDDDDYSFRNRGWTLNAALYF
ncbi:MAG: porin family protein [Bacteroidales bacterium]